MARARRGQNFLYHAGWQRRVAAAVDAHAGDTVVEIGGGRGEISARLAESGARLAVIEIDSALAEGLRRRLPSPDASGPPRISGPPRVLEADILQVDLGALAAEMGAGRLRIFGNLPYYIASPILFHLFRFADLITDATVMVQREVAARILATPGHEYGLLTAVTQFHCRSRKLFDLPPGAFRPAPQVHSTLLRLEFAPRADELGVDAAAFLRFLRLAFAHKRKLLRTTLAAAYGTAAVDAAMRAAGTPPAARAEAMGLEALAALHCRLRHERPAAPGMGIPAAGREGNPLK